MQSSKPLEFHGTAGGYFVLSVLTVLLMYIPFFGWALLLNYASGWFADNTLVNGQKVKYNAGYGESLGFVALNALLLIITLGIYSFWFYPKMYRYIVNHTAYLGAVSAEPVAPMAPAAPVPPVVPQQPSVAPTSPVAGAPVSQSPVPPTPPTRLVQ